MFRKVGRTGFWKLGYWLARKYRRGFRPLMRDHVRSPEPGRAKTWMLKALKIERLHGQRFETIRQAKDEAIAWLLWYNRTRLHSTLN
jgi:Integrase core domain